MHEMMICAIGRKCTSSQVQAYRAGKFWAVAFNGVWLQHSWLHAEISSPDLCFSPSKIRVKELKSTEKCPLCQLPLGSTGCNDSHIRRDAEVDPVTYKFRMCKYDTLEKKEMEKHLKVHTEEIPPYSSHRLLRANSNLIVTGKKRTVEGGRYPISIR